MFVVVLYLALALSLNIKFDPVVSTFVFSMNFANFTQDGGLKKYLEISKMSKELFVILSVFIAPVLEEVLLRGVLFGGYVKKNRFFAYFSSIVMFVVLHGTLTHVFLSLFMGLFFCLLYEISENIKYCIFSHFIFNLCSFLGGGTYFIRCSLVFYILYCLVFCLV